VNGQSDQGKQRESLLEQYDDPDPRVRVTRIAAAQRDAFDGWVLFPEPALRRAALALERSGVLAIANARDVRLAPRGRAFRLVH
jgi:hypothetical protein